MRMHAAAAAAAAADQGGGGNQEQVAQARRARAYGTKCVRVCTSKCVSIREGSFSCCAADDLSRFKSSSRRRAVVLGM